MSLLRAVYSLESFYAAACILATLVQSHTVPTHGPKILSTEPVPQAQRSFLRVKDITNIPAGGALCDRERGTSIYISVKEITKAIKGGTVVAGDNAHSSGKFRKKPRVGLDGSCDVASKFYEGYVGKKEDIYVNFIFNETSGIANYCMSSAFDWPIASDGSLWPCMPQQKMQVLPVKHVGQLPYWVDCPRMHNQCHTNASRVDISRGIRGPVQKLYSNAEEHYDWAPCDKNLPVYLAYLKDGAVAEHFMFDAKTGKATHCLAQASDAPFDAENDIIACIEHVQMRSVLKDSTNSTDMVSTEPQTGVEMPL